MPGLFSTPNATQDEKTLGGNLAIQDLYYRLYLLDGEMPSIHPFRVFQLSIQQFLLHIHRRTLKEGRRRRKVSLQSSVLHSYELDH